MTESLPITILLDDELALRFDKIRSAVNKLEAQFNFQAMTANWYGDENDITLIQLCLFTPESFSKAHKTQREQNLEQISDDVFTVTQYHNKLLICNVAITTAELTLLTQQKKNISGFC